MVLYIGCVAKYRSSTLNPVFSWWLQGKVLTLLVAQLVLMLV